MRLNTISSESSRGKGWARVAFKEFSEINTLSSLAIVRPRHTEPYLGRHGWQISESRLPLNLEKSTDTDFSLLLPPAVVQHLEVASNYEFIFFDKNVIRISQVIVRWFGISYRAPRGEISPIDVIQQDEISTLDNFFGSSINQPEANKFESNNEAKYAGSISGTLDAWNPGNFSTTSDTEYRPSDSSFLEQNPFIPTTTTLPLTSSRVVRRVTCRNVNCRAEILDSMQICPFCQTLKE
jgi:hypothetical protein